MDTLPVSDLLYGVVVLSLAFIIHLLIWRIRPPKHQTAALVRIFFGTYLLSLPVLYGLSRAGCSTVVCVPRTVFDSARTSLFFASFALAYIITYSALEADSPSLAIVRIVSEAGPKGLNSDALSSTFSDEVLVKPRVQDLLRDGMVAMRGDRFFLTRRGRWFVRIFILYRSLLNAQRGG
jgi:hypothetical protein